MIISISLWNPANNFLSTNFPFIFSSPLFFFIYLNFFLSLLPPFFVSYPSLNVFSSSILSTTLSPFSFKCSMSDFSLLAFYSYLFFLKVVELRAELSLPMLLFVTKRLLKREQKLDVDVVRTRYKSFKWYIFEYFSSSFSSWFMRQQRKSS